VLTEDALLCQRTLCRQVLAAGGDDLLLVTENQPTLDDDIRLLFDHHLTGAPCRCWTGAKRGESTAGTNGRTRRATWM